MGQSRDAPGEGRLHRRHTARRRVGSACGRFTPNSSPPSPPGILGFRRISRASRPTPRSLRGTRKVNLRRPMSGFVPDRKGFFDLIRSGRLTFVYREVLADGLTPVSTYARLGRGPYSFLLESVVGGEKWVSY